MWGGVLASKYSSASGVEVRPSISLRCGWRPKRAITSRAPSSLRGPELHLRPQVGWGLYGPLLGVADAPFLEGQVLGVGDGHPEEEPLLERQPPVHPGLDALQGES